jgi:phage terminase small subunit
MLTRLGGEVIAGKTGGLYQNPWLHTANKAWEQVAKAGAEFGMSPAERSRVRTIVSDRELSLVDELFAIADE